MENRTDVAGENCTLLVPEEAIKGESQGGSREVRQVGGILLPSVFGKFIRENVFNSRDFSEGKHGRKARKVTVPFSVPGKESDCPLLVPSRVRFS